MAALSAGRDAREPLRQWVLSVPFALRFLLERQPTEIGSVLGIVYRAIATHLIQKAGLTHATGQTGAVTLIQRFCSALNLNIHFHMLFLDGVYVTEADAPCFRRVQPPTAAELDGLITRISARVGRYLERQGLLVRDMENSYLARETEDDAVLGELLSHSITYRIAVGPQQGRKAFTLQTLPACDDEGDARQVANAAGFSLHAGVAAEADERQKLERLCRYIARPAVSKERLSLTNQGHIRYAMPTR